MVLYKYHLRVNGSGRFLAIHPLQASPKVDNEAMVADSLSPGTEESLFDIR
jgi:hypothetical protein